MNKINPLISIVIPTFNQSEMLDFLFNQHIKLFKKYNISVIVSDNASTDDTAIVVRKWQKESSLISYYRNSKNIGFDKNVMVALSYSGATYAWLMGDTYYISESLIKAVTFKLSNNDVDVCIINLENMLKGIKSKIYENQSELLSDLGGIMTCLSCLIFHKRVTHSNGFDQWVDSLFMHMGMVLHYINNKNFKMAWIADQSIESLKHPTLNKRNWSHGKNVLDIGFKAWVKFVFSLPESYTLQSKKDCIKSFGKLSKLATLRGFFLMRLRGQIAFDSYKKYEYEINLSSTLPKFIIVSILIIPKWMIRAACKFVAVILGKKGVCY